MIVALRPLASSRLCWIALPLALSACRSKPYEAWRAELPATVDGIQTAENAYGVALDSFIAVDAPWPRPVSALNGEPTPWSFGSDFDTLGWQSTEPLRGTYKVEVKPDGSDFVVHGYADFDGDGVTAHYTATKTVNAVRLSPENVY